MVKGHHPYALRLAGCIAAVWLLFFANLASAADATLAWDPNSEVDLAGYGVYYQKFPPDQQYDLFGYVALAELDDSGSPAFTVSGLDLGSQYQFAVTAYDSAGNESAYSIPVCAEIGSVNSVISCPSSESDGGGGGGGGGGGCFISTLPGEHEDLGLSAMGLLLMSFLAFIMRRNQRAK
jgi:hypothetical protein